MVLLAGCRTASRPPSAQPEWPATLAAWEAHLIEAVVALPLAHPSRRQAADAAKALRALRHGRSSQVMPVCRRVLAQAGFKADTLEAAALLNEALSALTERFDEEPARALYVRFATTATERYGREDIESLHWQGTRQVFRISVDLVTPLTALTRHEDPRAKDVLRHFLQLSVTRGGLTFDRIGQLDPDGVTFRMVPLRAAMTVPGRDEN